MPLTLVLGPAASGKTQALVDRAAARYGDDVFAPTLVLVPTGRHGDQFRRRLVSSVPAAFGLEVSVMTGWGRETVAATGARVAGRGIVAGLVRQAIYAATDAGEASTFTPIRHTRGLHARVEDAVRELVAEGIEPEALADAGNQPDIEALADVYAHFHERAAAAGVLHPSATIHRAAAAVEHATANVPPLVLIDGFEYLHAGEIALVEALSRATEVLLALDPEASLRSAHVYERLLEAVPEAIVTRVERTPGPVERTATEASDRDAELRAIARDIKDRLTSDPSLRPSDFALAFRQATPRLSMARQVFAEFNLPLDPAAGFPLAELPFGTWGRRFLRLGADGWRLRDLLAVLRSGYINRSRWEMNRGHVAAIARFGRRYHHWGGAASLRAIADGLQASDREGGSRGRDYATAAKLRSCLDDLLPLLDPDRMGTPSDFARGLDSALFGANPIVRPSNDARAGADAFRGLLRARIESDEVLGSEPASFGDLADWLVEDMERTVLSLREAGGVVLAPAHTLHGLRFHHLAIGGLSEGEFPAPRRLPGLLDGEARTALIDAGLPLPEQPRASEDELFASASTRADATLVLSHPRLDPDGKPRAASHFFPTEDEVPTAPADLRPERAASLTELALALVKDWPRETRRPKGYAAWPGIRRAADVESKRRSFTRVDEYEGQLPPGMAARLVAPEVKWSASRLETYVGCPFGFFAQYGLGLSELDDELLQADAAMIGTVVHEIAEEAVKPLIASDRPLSTETLPEVLERVDDAGRELWNGAPARKGFGRAGLWRMRWKKTRDRIHRMLEREAWESEDLRAIAVAGVEHPIDTTLELPDGPLRFRGMIDRLDEAGDLAIVVDYKSGRPIKEDAVENAERLQLQLYSQAIMTEQPRFKSAVARFSYLRPTTEKQRFALDTREEHHRATVQAALERVAEIRTRSRAGRFEVVPGPFLEATTPRACPSYCDFKYICRSTPLARWKS